MTNPDELLSNLLSKISIIDSDDIPSIDLYMDQVTTFMDKYLSNNKRFEEDKILTKTMINNYSKNELLPAPIKKRYSKDHVILLIFIYYLKNILSINDINTLLSPLIDEHYDSNNKVNLDMVYKYISKMENSLLSDIKKNIESEINISNEAISDIVSDESDFLSTFSLITALSFDVYIKKQLIESMIDDIAKNTLHDSDIKEKTKEKSKEKVKDKPKEKTK